MSLGSPKLIQRLAAAAAFNNTAAHTLVDGLVTPANFWTVGKILNWTGAFVQSAVNGTDTLRVRCLVGPTTLTGTAVADSGAVTGAANLTMTWNLWLQCVSSSVLTVWGSYSILGTIGTVTHRAAYSSVTGLDFTAALRFEVTGLYSAANASNTANCQANVYVEYPG
jgi:hypothetical protein